MGTLAMLLTLTLACIQSAMLFNKFFELSALNRCTFDAQVSAEDPAVLTEAADYFQEDTRNKIQSAGSHLPMRTDGAV